MPAKISAPIRQRAARIKLFLCDVDGVGASWIATGSAAPRRFSTVRKYHKHPHIFRPRESGVAAPALPPHSMTLNLEFHA